MANNKLKFNLYNLNIDILLSNLQIIKDRGYKYVDIEVSNNTSDKEKYTSSLTFYPLERQSSIVIRKSSLRPNRKLTIDELIKYHS